MTIVGELFLRSLLHNHLHACDTALKVSVEVPGQRRERDFILLASIFARNPNRMAQDSSLREEPIYKLLPITEIISLLCSLRGESLCAGGHIRLHRSRDIGEVTKMIPK